MKIKILSTTNFNSIIKNFLIVLFCIFLNSYANAQADSTGMRGITAMQATSEMAPGINLYNTLDATGTWVSGLPMETMWGNPYTTFEMVESMAERGFKTLRIPVSWGHHTGSAPDYKVHKSWMDRVETVVNYALDNGMYAIINCHHDDEHFVPTRAKQAEGTEWLESIWTQIATRFKDYGDYLIFETMNEPREKGTPHEWTGGKVENWDVINDYNLSAVNAIRATGGNNEKRFIMIPQYAAGYNAADKHLQIPNGDTTNIILSLHNYSPYWFTLGGGTARWGTPQEIRDIQNEIRKYANRFVKKGLPVVIGEWGAGNNDNYGDRVMHYHTFANACVENDITPLVWIYEFNRRTLTWKLPLLEEAIFLAYDSTTVYADDIELNVVRDTLYGGDSLQLIATVTPDSVTAKDIAWTTYKPEVATVSSSGLVKANQSGYTIITATTPGKKTHCIVHVQDTIVDTEFHVEAEDYMEQSGVQTESCSDANGGKNVGYIQNGDWCSYTLAIDTAGVYNFSVRAATDTNGGNLEIKADNKPVGTVKIEGSKSNGWQDWYTTDEIEIELEKGIQTIKLTFRGGGGYLYNLNWFKLNYSRAFNATSINEIPADEAKIRVYPNPVKDVLNLNYQINTRSSIEAKIFNAQGTLMETLIQEANQGPGNYTLNWKNDNLPNGIYLIRFGINGRIKTQKVIINTTY